MRATDSSGPILDLGIPTAFIDMPSGLDGYWWETDKGVCVPVVASTKPKAFLHFLNQLEAKEKPVFFPTVLNERLASLLKIRGYIMAFTELSPAEKEFTGQHFVDGLAKIPDAIENHCPDT